MKNNYDTTLIRFKKGAKQLIQTAAKEQNESVNAYIKKAIQTRYTSILAIISNYNIKK